MAAYQNALAVVIVPFPTQGHLTPLLRLSRRIAAFNFPVHFLGSETTCYQAVGRSDIGYIPDANTFLFHCFPTPEFENDSPNSESRFPTHLWPMISATLSGFGEPLSVLVNDLASENHRVVVIFDALMASTVKSVDAISLPNVESYVFETSSAFTIYSVYWERYGDPEIPPEAAEAMSQIPPLDDCFSREFKEFVTLQYEARDFHSGTIFNSGKSIEESYLDLLANLPQFGNRIWAIGPLNPVHMVEGPYPVGDLECLRWIRNQPRKSVLLVSLGTTVSLSDDQIKELAEGLLNSEVSFVWLLRDADRGDIFKGGARVIELPQQFEESVRNNGRGIVVRDWVSQHEILEMTNIGGFLSSCGWNSCLESISAGVPIAAWPMHSDQPRNAVLVTEVLKIGVEVREWQFRNGLVYSFDIVRAIQRLMNSVEGAEIRQRVEELEVSVERSWAETNRSRVEMNSFIARIARND